MWFLNDIYCVPWGLGATNALLKRHQVSMRLVFGQNVVGLHRRVKFRLYSLLNTPHMVVGHLVEIGWRFGFPERSTTVHSGCGPYHLLDFGAEVPHVKKRLFNVRNWFDLGVYKRLLFLNRHGLVDVVRDLCLEVVELVMSWLVPIQSLSWMELLRLIDLSAIPHLNVAVVVHGAGRGRSLLNKIFFENFGGFPKLLFFLQAACFGALKILPVVCALPREEHVHVVGFSYFHGPVPLLL